MGELEFGHRVWAGSGFRADAWGVGPFIITAGDKSFRFEDSDRFGPYLVAKDGRVLDGQPGERSPFWRAHWHWREQGRRTKADGITCIWTPPRPSIVGRVGRNLITIIHGDRTMDGEILIIIDPHKELCAPSPSGRA